MKIRLGTKTVEFRKGFKPESLSEFSSTYGKITGADDKELKSVYKKLRGYTRGTSKKSKED